MPRYDERVGGQRVRRVHPDGRSRRVEKWKAARSGRRARQSERRDVDRLRPRQVAGDRGRPDRGRSGPPAGPRCRDRAHPRNHRRRRGGGDRPGSRRARLGSALAGDRRRSRFAPGSASGDASGRSRQQRPPRSWSGRWSPFPSFSGPAENARYAPVSERPAGGPTLSVAFLPEATEADMRALLQEIDARISDGPSAIGLWQLSFADDAARDAGLARLQGRHRRECASELTGGKRTELPTAPVRRS